MGQTSDLGYDFEQQRLVEAKYTPLIIEYLRKSTLQNPIDERHLCLEHDFRISTTYDLKADTLIGRTNNFFIETESVKGKKKGWLYNATDWILYLDTQYLILYSIKLNELRAKENIIKQWNYQEIRQKSNYLTCGYTVPISILAKHVPVHKVLLRYYLSPQPEEAKP